MIITMDKPHDATALYTSVSDLDFDGKTDEADMLIIANAFGSKIGGKNYEQRMDFDNNGVINIIDLVMVAKHFEATT